MIAALVCAAASVTMLANPCVRRPVAKFIYFYQQEEDLGPLERILYSLVMTNSTTEPSS